MSNFTHGHATRGKRTPEYQAWLGMLARCSNPRNKYFKDYGGRGITICEEWKQFKNFFSFMGKRPEGLTLDRINNELGYYPGNVRWTTWAQQNRNKRDNVNLTINGETKCLTDWARLSGVHYETIRGRLCKGWDAGKAVFTKPHGGHRIAAP